MKTETDKNLIKEKRNSQTDEFDFPQCKIL